ncbi:MAG: AIR synthase-related protein [Acidobacteriota bacterium]|nr:AIR synthase-related protein [Acidobacteriota bacterium]MDH3785542.1 AIR synthase-related protein [Acidobacteriota bacterium]
MVTRLEIGTHAGLQDPRGAKAAHRVRSFLNIPVERIETCDVYRIDADLSGDDARRVLRELVDPVSQRGALNRLETDTADQIVCVGYKPGVTDPVGKSARVAIEDTLGRALGDDATVYTSQLYRLHGVDGEQARRIAEELLANPVIQTIEILDHRAWLELKPDLEVPRVTSDGRPPVRCVDLGGDAAELERISREGLLALTIREMTTIRDHFVAAAADPRRQAAGLVASPTDVELECLAQTWSEHCQHKIFNATVTYHEQGHAPETIPSLFKQFIRGATENIDREVIKQTGESWLVSVFHDNAGVVTFDDERHLVYKVETHNSPSALDPYGGAMTGIVGVNRDPFGTGIGSDLIANVWGYCFASPFYDDKLPGGLLHPRRVRDGVHQGVIDGGNQSGVPYSRGFEVFDERYLGKPLVFCGTVGSLPVTVAGKPGEEKAARPGDLIVMTGGRIGADGIHGATFSSAALDETAPVQAVQIGDPITQKMMFDFLIEARDAGLYCAITDNGAGGLSSSVGEMAEASGGARLDLERAPLKYQGLAPWEILVSEAQERMTLAVPPKDLDALLELARRRQVEATVLGEFTDDGNFHVTYGDETVALLSMEFLHEGAPDLELTARWERRTFEEPDVGRDEDLAGTLVEMVGRLNLCSGETKARHYDHEVKALSVIKPFIGAGRDIPADATVSLLRHGSLRGFVLSESIQPFLSDLDSYAMSQTVVDEAVRRQICAGARLDRIALLDNFCWPDPVQSVGTPDGEYKMAQLVRSCRGLHDAVLAYGTPLISGKDSMKNDSTMGGVKISVPATLLVSAIGQIDDVRNALTLEPRHVGDRVYLLGTTRCDTGGSEYLRLLGARDGVPREIGAPAPYIGNRVPQVRLEETIPMYQATADACSRGLVQSISTPGRGGLGLTLVRMLLAAEDLGLDIDLSPCADLQSLPADVALFSESNGRFVATVRPEDAPAFESMFAGLLCRPIGDVVIGGELRISDADREWLSVDAATLRHAFKETLSHA